MQVPDGLHYSSDHEWVRQDDGRVRIGITDYAQDALGDVVFVSLPELGSRVEAHGVLGEVESTKSVSEIYAPVAGEVVAVNEALTSAPEQLNSRPLRRGMDLRDRPHRADRRRRPSRCRRLLGAHRGVVPRRDGIR